MQLIVLFLQSHPVSLLQAFILFGNTFVKAWSCEGRWGLPDRRSQSQSLLQEKSGCHLIAAEPLSRLGRPWSGVCRDRSAPWRREGCTTPPHPPPAPQSKAQQGTWRRWGGQAPGLPSRSSLHTMCSSVHRETRSHKTLNQPDQPGLPRRVILR